jgi:hypothetical protein
MRLFRNLSLVVKLAARRGAVHGADGDGDDLRDPRSVLRKGARGRRTAGQHGASRLRGSLAGNSEAIRYGQPMAITTRRRSGTGRPSSIRRTPSTGSAMSPGARLTFFTYDAGTGAFRRTLTNVRQADGRPAVGTTLGPKARRGRPFRRGRVFGLFEVVGTDLSDDLRTGPSAPSGTVTGAIAAAVPQGSLAAATREIIQAVVVVDPVARLSVCP